MELEHIKTEVVIKLSNSDMVCFVDEADYELVSKYTWYVMGRKAYIRTSQRIGGKVKTIYLHRLIMNPEPTEDVHHMDRDTFNNRRSNLECVPAEGHRGHPKTNY